MTENLEIRALIIDDELMARRKIRKLLARHPDVDVIKDCANGYEAIAAINEHTPDLVFLDVWMPEISGFDVLKQIEESMRPLVIFVTVDKDHALQGHDVEAVHYLLKPLDQNRFDEAMHRAKNKLAKEREREKTRSNYNKPLMVEDGGRIIFLNKADINWIKAERKYVKLYVGRKSYLMRAPISALETRLDPDKFLRIHRSYIVNINYVLRLDPLCKQDCLVILRDGTELRVSDRGRKKIAALVDSI